MINMREIDTSDISDMRRLFREDKDFADYCTKLGAKHELTELDDVLSQAIVRAKAEYMIELYKLDNPE